jgi:hypothetical protein
MFDRSEAETALIVSVTERYRSRQPLGAFRPRRMIEISSQRSRMDFDAQPMIGTVTNRGLHDFVASQVIARYARAGARAVDLGAGPGAMCDHLPEALLNRLALYSETLDPRSPASELMNRTRDYPLANFLGAFSSPRWAYGFGIGTVSLGGQYVSRIFHVPPPTDAVESGFGNIILELGIVGLLLWFVMSGAVLFSAWKVVRKLKGSPWFPLGFMIFWYAFLLLLPFTFQGMQAYQDFVLNAYLWLLLGILFRLPKLAQAAQLTQDAQATASPAPQFIYSGNR